MGGLEQHDEIGIKSIEFARGIEELTLYLIVFSFEEVSLITMFDADTLDGCGQELRSGITYQGHLELW